RRGLSDDVLTFDDRRQVFNVFGDLAIYDFAVGRLNKAVIVGAGIGRKGVDQTNVWPFRCFDGTDAAIVGGMNIAHLKAGALTGQTTGTKSRNTALVGHFRERVVLIHKLRQLTGAEK